MTTDIIILVHNGWESTQKCCDHIKKHSSEYRLCLWDNGSTDESTISLLKNGAYNGLWELNRSETNLGIVTGRNRAVKYFLKNDRFVILDNDQFVNAGWLDSLHAKMDQGYDIVGSESWHLMHPNVANKSMAYYPYRRCVFKDERFCYINCGGQMISKRLYETIGLYDEQFNPAYFEDPDLSFRALQLGFNIGWAFDCTIEHRRGSTTSKQKAFNNKEQFKQSFLRFQCKWFPYYCEVDNYGRKYERQSTAITNS